MHSLMSTPYDVGSTHEHSSSDLQLTTHQGYSSFVVWACGRSVSVPEDISTMNEMQTSLQTELSMKDQIFELFDCDGTKLVTDVDIQHSISKRKTPLTATLSDVSIHLIENRREELAQMQWKLIRDGQKGSQMKVDSLQRNLQSIETALSMQAQDNQANLDRLKSELSAALESHRADVRQTTRALEEQVAGVSNLIATERNVREVGSQRLQGELRSLREVIDANRHFVQQVVSHAQTEVEKSRVSVHHERSMREAFEEQSRVAGETLKEQVNESVNRVNRALQECQQSFSRHVNEMTSTVDAHHQKSLTAKSAYELANEGSANQISSLEERMQILEKRAMDMGEIQHDALDRISHRCEKVSMSVETQKADLGKQSLAMQQAITRMADVEKLLERVQADVQDRMSDDRRQRQTELRTFKESARSEHTDRLSQLEQKLNSRLERESAAREEHVTVVLAKAAELNMRDGNRSDEVETQVNFNMDVSSAGRSEERARVSRTSRETGSLATVRTTPRNETNDSTPAMERVGTRSMLVHGTITQSSPSLATEHRARIVQAASAQVAAAQSTMVVREAASRSLTPQPRTGHYQIVAASLHAPSSNGTPNSNVIGTPMSAPDIRNGLRPITPFRSGARVSIPTVSAVQPHSQVVLVPQQSARALPARASPYV
eukprot:TRINITY_DN4361_c0_g3_i1.p1 TRINITY_DN4361_c0_g3~~TRINITY_DN4361_c0_g3_i1.p1  ORF type:complete len:664 (-),score=98.01 TRINITY_DN4361_c0_g3_i1:66-2057(-)